MPRSVSAERFTMLPFDFAILSPLRLRNSWWSQKRENGRLPVAHSDCAISLLWCVGIRSIPPVWISICLPKVAFIIAEHSMCQPGKPLPHGESHPIFGSDFHRRKSVGLRLSSAEATRAPSFRPSISIFPRLPYVGNADVSKYKPSLPRYAYPFSSSIFSSVGLSPSRFKAIVILSLPLSASELKCPKSVMLMICLTSKPLSSSALRTRSAKTYERRLPMCEVSYTVGPQLYMRTGPRGGAVNSSLDFVSVL